MGRSFFGVSSSKETRMRRYVFKGSSQSKKHPAFGVLSGYSFRRRGIPAVFFRFLPACIAANVRVFPSTFSPLVPKLVSLGADFRVPGLSRRFRLPDFQTTYLLVRENCGHEPSHQPLPLADSILPQHSSLNPAFPSERHGKNQRPPGKLLLLAPLTHQKIPFLFFCA